MECSKCGFENPDQAKFCIECGTPFKFQCPNCGAETSANGKFCMACGFELKPGQKSSLIELSIDEKIAFWQKVMEHAHNRGINIVWFTWNIFISPGTGEMVKPESDGAIAYMQKAVREMVTTYPHLSGFGVTAGERMGMTVGKYTATQWMFETYGKGIIAAKEADPDRPFRFIFRRHHTTLHRSIGQVGRKRHKSRNRLCRPEPD